MQNKEVWKRFQRPIKLNKEDLDILQIKDFDCRSDDVIDV